MFCRKCGKKISDDTEYCEKCGAKVVNVTESSTEKTSKDMKKIRYSISDVVNKESVLNSTNKVACLAKGWALRVERTGTVLAVIIMIVAVCLGINSENSPSSGYTFFEYFIYGLISAFVVMASFNTIAFIIRMGAEVIQLLDDIKMGRKE